MGFRMMAAVAVLAAACGAHAQSIKPGLWEITSKMSGNPEMEKAMAEIQKQLAAMPPAQRKQMEQMMAQQGVKWSPSGSGTAATMCFSKKMAEELDLPVSDKSKCSYTRQPRLGNSMKFSFICDGGKTTGQGEYTFAGDSGWNGDITLTTTENSKKQTMKITSKGRWLGAQCGNVKPFDETPMGKSAK